jgi:hypothetical protein
MRFNNPTRGDGWTTGRVSKVGDRWLDHYQGKDFLRRPWYSTVWKSFRRVIILSSQE